MKSLFYDKKFNIALAALLFVVQLGILIHQAEIESHAFGSSCDHCIHVSTTDKTPLLSSFSLPLQSIGESISPPVLLSHSHQTPSFNARAPPFSFNLEESV